MRLIDAESLADALYEKGKNYPQWVADTIGSMPDAIVRCKDCKYRVEEPNGELYCDILAVEYEPLGSKKVSSDWFCADGKRG